MKKSPVEGELSHTVYLPQLCHNVVVDLAVFHHDTNHLLQAREFG